MLKTNETSSGPLPAPDGEQVNKKREKKKKREKEKHLCDPASLQFLLLGLQTGLQDVLRSVYMLPSPAGRGLSCHFATCGPGLSQHEK